MIIFGKIDQSNSDFSNSINRSNNYLLSSKNTLSKFWFYYSPISNSN